MRKNRHRRSGPQRFPRKGTGAASAVAAALAAALGITAAGIACRPPAAPPPAANDGDTAAGKTGLAWSSDFAAAQAEARTLRRPILAYFSGSDWCGWCARLEREVFSRPAFRAYAASNLVLFVADFPQHRPLPPKVRAQNERLARQYAIEGFPTILLLDAEGKVLARTGYRPGGAEAYTDHLRLLMAETAGNTAP